MRPDWARRVNWLLNRIAQEAASAVDRDLPVSVKRKTVDLALDLQKEVDELLREAGVELAAQAAEESAALVEKTEPGDGPGDGPAKGLNEPG